MRVEFTYGPFKLSVQPAIGSIKVGITIDGLSIIAGNLSFRHASFTNAYDKIETSINQRKFNYL